MKKQKMFDKNQNQSIPQNLVIIILTININFINCVDKTYGVIVDCGSSGSRAHLFQWDSYLRYPELLNNVEPLRDLGNNNQPLTKKIHPGLSSLMYNPEQAFEYLSPIIEFVSEKIPEKSHKATSIYVLATAGMRLLDAETQLEIMNDLIEDFQSENSFASFKTSVISGSSEGMYQWITVNSLAKRFNINGPQVKLLDGSGDNGGSSSSSSELEEQKEEATNSIRTLGLIEMGGASIQVTYQLTDEIKESILESFKNKTNSNELIETFKDQIVEPKISREAKDYKYKLVSTTFLGFGGNSARLAYVDLLVNKHIIENKFYEQKNQISSFYTKQSPLIIKDSCLPIGSSETVTRPARILTIPKENSNLDGQQEQQFHQTVGFNMEEDDITISVRLDGAGNYQNCYDDLKEMLMRAKREKLNCKKDQVCTMSLIDTKFVPFHEFEFLGLSDFYYTSKEMINLPGQFKQQLFIEKTKEICQTPYKRLLILYPDANKFDKSRVLRECFKAVWIDIFLKYVVNIPDDYKHFETVGKINGDDIDWTLGAILDNSLSMEIARESNEMTIDKITDE